ncbi:MAG: hypothetical protein JXA60_10765 [Candidatus Coatesbacteria bacterium]|nr:hypothetical protein [Candidatus Coatesbacteria bacterium]
MFKPQALQFIRLFIPQKELFNAASAILDTEKVHFAEYSGIKLFNKEQKSSIISKDSEIVSAVNNLYLKTKKIIKKLEIIPEPKTIRKDLWTLEQTKQANRRLDSWEKSIDEFRDKQNKIKDSRSRNEFAKLIKANWDWLTEYEAQNFVWYIVEIPTNYDIDSILNLSDKSGSQVITHLMLVGTRKAALIVTHIKEKEQIEKALKNHGLLTISSTGFRKEIADFKIEGEHANSEKINTEILYLFNEIIWQKYLIEFHLNLQQIPRGYLFFGFVPKKDIHSISNEIEKRVPGSLIDFIEPPLTEDSETGEMGFPPMPEPPVKLNNPKLIKPFELITTSYSIPRYRDIDPTAIVAFVFLLMFGLMFGDIGHGSVLAIIGIIISLKLRDYRNIGYLMISSGISSVIFGILFGSCFGFEFKPLWLKPLENIELLVFISICFGIFVMFLGMFFQILQKLKRRDWIGFFIGPWGLATSSVYGLILGFSAYVYFNPESSKWALFALVISMVLLLSPIAFQVQIIKYLNRRKLRPLKVHGDTLSSFAEIAETILSYFANTVSFIRVSAFGLNHAALSLAVFAISDAFSKNGVPTGGVDIIIGNISIILLEGLIVSIQCLRLLYYEFFSKFFTGGGSLYRPLSENHLYEEVK